MGWWRNWRERRVRQDETPQESPVTIHSILNDLAKIRLETETAHAKFSLDEAIALQAERKEIREEKRADRQKAREARAAAAQYARDIRSGKIKPKNQREAEGACGLCSNPFRIDVTPEMVAKHREHSPLTSFN